MKCESLHLVEQNTEGAYTQLGQASASVLRVVWPRLLQYHRTASTLPVQRER